MTVPPHMCGHVILYNESKLLFYRIETGDSPRRSPSPDRVDRQKFRRERERPAPYPKGGKRGQGPPYNRVLVSNIPYEEKWQVIKDLFREKGNSSKFYTIQKSIFH